MDSTEFGLATGYGRLRLADHVSQLTGSHCSAVRLLYGGELALTFGDESGTDALTITTRGSDWFVRGPSFLTASTNLIDAPEKNEGFEQFLFDHIGNLSISSVETDRRPHSLIVRFAGGFEFVVSQDETVEDLGIWECFRPDGMVVVRGPDDAWAVVDGQSRLDALSLMKAYSLLRHGFPESAQELFEALLSEDEVSTAAAIGKALAIGAQSEHEMARSLLAELAEELPERGDVLLYAGVAAWNVEAVGEAVECFKAAARVAPSWPRAWTELAVAYGRLEQWEEALVAFERARALGGATDFDADAWRNYGIVLGQLGRQPEAEQRFRRAIRLDPNDGQNWNNLGIALARMDKFVEAEDAQRQATMRDPLFPYGWADLAKLLNNLRRYAEAELAALQGVAVAPREVELWSMLAVAYAGLGVPDRALWALGEAEAIDNGHPLLWDVRADILRLFGPEAAAAQLPERAPHTTNDVPRRDPRLTWESRRARAYAAA